MTIDWTAIGKILVHKPDHIGDALCAAPSIALLREAAPGAKIFIATTAASGAFLTVLRLADELMLLPGPSWWKTSAAVRYVSRARRERFDLVVNFRFDARDIFLCGFLGSKRVCTPTYKGFGKSASHPGPAPSDTAPEILNHLALVASLGLKPSRPYRASISLEDSEQAKHLLPEGAKWIAFHPFARTEAKSWTPDKALETVRLLVRRGYRVAVIGGPESARMAEDLFAEEKGAVNLTGRTPPGLLLAVIARADLLVSTDSAPGHAAPIVGTKVLSIMSGTNRHGRWAPMGATVIHHEVPCAPCALEVCNVAGHPCMYGIEPARAADEAERILRE